MDGSRFDDFTRVLVTSRRGALRTLLSAAAAALVSVVTGVAAQDDARRNPFHRAGLPCDPGRCGRLAPCEFGLCTPKACLIDGATRQDLTEKPGEPCQFCAATLTTWTEWSALTDGTECQSSDQNPCREASGICIQGVCARNTLSDNECGPEKVCCDGDCCDPLEICVDYDCTPGCVIDGTKYRAFVGNPPESPLCQFCYPDRDRTAWTIMPDGPNELCEECCQGTCCEPGKACGAGGCEPGCTIPFSGFKYRMYIDGEHNPDNPCQFCSLSVSDSAWTPDDSQRCGSDNDQFCCNGECCPPGTCCDRGLACSAAECCLIEDIPYPANAAHPDSELCKSCKPDTSTDDWTNLPDDSPCGGGGTRVCCNGFCCPQDLCCDSDTGFCGRCRCDGEQGSAGIRASLLASCSVCCDGLCCGPDECCSEEGGCVPCASGCEIDGQFHAADAVNEANTCQICDPDRSQTDWTLKDDDEPCGGSPGQVCCAGSCCAEGECCTLGVCGSCGCEIDGVHYDHGARNPDVYCAVCDSAFPTSWSPSLDRECPPPCIIDEVVYPHGTPNPLNVCEECDGSNVTTWSPRDHNTRCGPNQEQFCCLGVCCESGACCTPAGACAVGGALVCDGCDIDGHFYPNGERNPATVCQICEKAGSTTSWTNDDFWPCDDVPHRMCCHGFCCLEGEVCRNGNTESSFCD